MTVGEQRLDLTDPRQCGVYFVGHEDLDAIAQEAAVHSLWRGRIDLGECRGKQDVLARIADTMHFPPTFGHNWDALSDCLGDLQWLPAGGHVLLFEHGDVFGNAHPEHFDTLLDILDDVCADAASASALLFAFLAFPDNAFEASSGRVDP